MDNELQNKYNDENYESTYGKKEDFDTVLSSLKNSDEKISNAQVGNDQASILTDVPKQAYYGFKDAYNSFSNYVGDFVYEKMTGEEYEGNISEDVYGKKGEPAKTTAGAVTRTVAQSLAGYTLGGGVAKIVGLTKAAAGSAFLTKSLPFIKGFTGDFLAFDEHEKNLTDTLNDVGLQDNPIVKTASKFLKHEGDDSETEARLKNALEGGLVGGVADGVFKGIKYIKNGRIYKDFATKAGENINKGFSSVKETLSTLKEFNNPVNKKVKQVIESYNSSMAAAKMVEGTTDEFGIDVRPNRVVKTIEEQKAEATDLYNKKVNFVKSINDEYINDDAAKKLIDETTNSDEANKLTALTIIQNNEFNKLKELNTNIVDKFHIDGNAETLKDGINSTIDYMINVDGAIKDAFTPTSRALGLRSQEPAVVTANRIKDFLKNADGMTQQSILETITKMSDPEQLKTLMTGLNKASKSKMKLTSDLFTYLYQNSLLSSVKSLVSDTASTVLWQCYNSFEKYPAALISQARRGIFGDYGSKKDFISATEASVHLASYVDSIRDMFTNISRGFTDAYESKSLKPIMERTKETFTKYNMDIGDKFGTDIQQEFLDSNNWGINQESTFAHALNFMKKYDKFSPLQILAKKDGPISGVRYRAEIKSRSMRQALSEGLSGNELKERVNYLVKNSDVVNRMDDSELTKFVNNNTEINKEDLPYLQSIGSKSIKETEKALFRDDLGKFGNDVSRALNSMPGGRIIVPFFKTPVKILYNRFFMERSVGALISPKFYSTIMKGGADADLALGQLATGISLQGLGFYWANSGLTSGTSPRAKGQRETMLAAGIRPNSIRIGDTAVDLSRYQPLSNFLMAPANMVQIFNEFGDKLDEDDERSMLEYMQVSAIGTAAILKDSAWMRNVGDFMDIFVNENPDPEKVNKYLGNLASNIIPAIATDIKDSFNMQEYQQYSDNFLEKLKVKLGGDTRDALDVFGQPIRRGEDWYGFIPAINQEIKTDDRTMVELLNNEIYLAKPNRTITYNGQEVKMTSMEQYELLKSYDENNLGITVKGSIDKVINSESYKNLDKFINKENVAKAKKDLIMSVYNDTISIIKDNFINNTPRLKDMVAKKNALLAPSLATPRQKQVPSVNKMILGE